MEKKQSTGNNNNSGYLNNSDLWLDPRPSEFRSFEIAGLAMFPDGGLVQVSALSCLRDY